MGSWRSRQITLQAGNRWVTSLGRRGGYLFNFIRYETACGMQKRDQGSAAHTAQWSWAGGARLGGRSVRLKVSWLFLHTKQFGVKHMSATDSPRPSESPSGLPEPQFPYLHSEDFPFSHRDVSVPLWQFWAAPGCENTRVQAHTAPLQSLNATTATHETEQPASPTWLFPVLLADLSETQKMGTSLFVLTVVCLLWLSLSSVNINYLSKMSIQGMNLLFTLLFCNKHLASQN